MSENILLIIFLIVWFGIASYLLMIDRQIKQLKDKLSALDKPSAVKQHSNLDEN